ncbi:MAG: InlB B-repeat-containing protein, partial [Eubacterium sp.]|nr:InlB B-repeat-containing protein [Eubacterium sp.]
YGDITLQAQWNPRTYKITYIDCVNGKEVSTSATYTSDQELKFPKPTQESGDDRVFSWWQDTTTGKTYTAGSSIPTNSYKNLTYYAVYDEQSYTIKFVTNGGSKCNTITYKYADGASLPTPSKTGHDFLGWYKTANFSGDKITKIEASTTRGNMTLYAKWKAQTYTYTIIENGGDLQYDKNGKIIPRTVTVTYGEKMDLPDLKQNGMFLLGYSVYSDTTKAYDTENLLKNGNYCEIVGDKTIRAEWSRVKPNVKIKQVISLNKKKIKVKKSKKKKVIKIKAKNSGKGKLTYKLVKKPKKAKKYVTINKKGKIVIKKKAPKGTYKFTVTAKKTSVSTDEAVLIYTKSQKKIVLRIA